MQTMTTVPLAVFAPLLLAGLLAGCDELPALLRRHTYPPNFKYISQAQLHSAMWQLADQVTDVDRVMHAPGMSEPERRAEVERMLTDMLATTHALQVQGRPTNHPVIGEHLDGFERDLNQALVGVKAEPPNYYLVGTVSGACLSCHSPQ